MDSSSPELPISYNPFLFRLICNGYGFPSESILFGRQCCQWCFCLSYQRLRSARRLRFPPPQFSRVFFPFSAQLETQSFPPSSSNVTPFNHRTGSTSRSRTFSPPPTALLDLDHYWPFRSSPLFALRPLEIVRIQRPFGSPRAAVSV